MGKFFVLGLMLLHGLIHLAGFLKGFGSANPDALSMDITKLQGLFWLAAFLLFGITGLIAVFTSQILIIQYWQDAKLGALAKVLETTQRINGIHIPVKLEASWILEEGIFTWYQFEIYDVVLNGNWTNKSEACSSVFFL